VISVKHVTTARCVVRAHLHASTFYPVTVR